MQLYYLFWKTNRKTKGCFFILTSSLSLDPTICDQKQRISSTKDPNPSAYRCFFFSYCSEVGFWWRMMCLQGVKRSFGDQRASSARGILRILLVMFICKFVCLLCWNYRENRLINMELQDFRAFIILILIFFFFKKNGGAQPT